MYKIRMHLLKLSESLLQLEVHLCRITLNVILLLMP